MLSRIGFGGFIISLHHLIILPYRAVFFPAVKKNGTVGNFGFYSSITPYPQMSHILVLP